MQTSIPTILISCHFTVRFDSGLSLVRNTRMQKKSFFISFSLFLLVVSSSAGADGFQNSCEYSFKKAVYSITQHCALNFYEGETILTYGETPITTTAACTADRDIGPMGFEEAEALLIDLIPRIFDESNNSRIGSKLFLMRMMRVSKHALRCRSMAMNRLVIS